MNAMVKADRPRSIHAPVRDVTTDPPADDDFARLARELPAGWSQVVERSYPPNQQQVDDHDDHRHRRERGCEREVVGDADVDVDDVADELRARDELWRDVVAERQREGEDRPGR